MWRIDRRIVDARGPDAHFTGTATFQVMPDAPDVLTLAEAGHLKVGTQKAVAAHRTYKWTFTSPTTVEVLFADDRPFHRINLATPTPMARHDCVPDIYLVEYFFELPSQWRATWTVTGPRKNYVMTSHMTRA